MTPSCFVASIMGMKPGGVCSTKRLSSSLVMRISHGAPGVGCSAGMKPSSIQRSTVPGVQVEDFGGFADGHWLTAPRFGRSGSAGDATIVTQALNMPGSEAVSRDRATLLAIENAGDDAIGMMDGQTADEVDGFFIGSPRRWVGAWQGDF